MVGGIIFGSIGVAAATYFSADQISYTPSDTSWDVSTVDEALSDLYTSVSSCSDTKIYYLGTGTSFNIKTLLPEIDYTSLDTSNFIVEAYNGSGSARGDVNTTIGSVEAYSGLNKSYDASTGILNASGSIEARGYYNGKYYRYYGTSSVKAYLVIGTIS